jgi:heptose I phosphotransferase
MAVRGEIFKSTQGRTVYRFIRDGKAYFIKIHTGVGWGEILKNWVQGKWPVLGAMNEWKAIVRCRALGLRTLLPVAVGERGVNIARRQSFLITHELKNTVSLERITDNWQSMPPAVVLKRALIAELARVVNVMHRGGVNHRDCYLCHFRLDVSGGVQTLQPGALQLTVIDLHRAQIRVQVPRRWLIKDLAAIYFSSCSIGLTQRDLYRFMMQYTGSSLRDVLADKHFFWRDVKKTGEALYRKHHRVRSV